MDVREATYGPNAALAAHVHARQMLAVPLAGAFEIEIGRRRHLCRRGAAVTRPGETHANRFGPRGARLVLVEPDRELDLPSIVDHPHAQALAARLAVELRATDTAAPLAREALALELLALAARSEVRTDSLARVDAFLDDHFLEPLRLRDLAAIAGLHPSHLARSYRAARGEPLAASVRRRRVEWAKQRLLGSEQAIATIALDAGFCDQGHFTRVFRRIVGTTPKRWRNGA